MQFTVWNSTKIPEASGRHGFKSPLLENAGGNYGQVIEYTSNVEKDKNFRSSALFLTRYDRLN